MPKSIAFTTRIRFWYEQQQKGLAVVDIPARFVAPLGGRRQMRVSGTLNGKRFTGTTMLVRGGGFCVGITKDAMREGSVAVGDRVKLALKPAAASRDGGS
jgi:hypothetical protein